MPFDLPPPDPHPVEMRYTLERRGDAHDFDFIAGEWRVDNWCLKGRGTGATEWDRFVALSRAWVLLGGLANTDEVVFATKGTSGMTMRHFDIEKRQWSIYWINSRDGKLQPPVVGGFDGDVGLFYGEDTDAGRPVLAELRWTRLGAGRARWQQAFSYDQGRTWEVNWVMALERIGPVKS
jgi:hypothetical protein